MKLNNIRQGREGFSSWGCYWPQATVLRDQGFVCLNQEGHKVAMDSRVTAYWADGSVKWTAHSADAAKLGQTIEVLPISAADRQAAEAAVKADRTGILIRDEGDRYTVDNHLLQFEIPKGGPLLLKALHENGKLRMTKVFPVYMVERHLHDTEGIFIRNEELTGQVDHVTIESFGPEEMVIKFEGSHLNKKGEGEIPFIIRLMLGNGSNELRFVHTFIYDGDENVDYLKGMGIRFISPVEGALYNRHVKFSVDHGVFHESPMTLISWKPRVPEGLFEAQMRGELLCENDEKAAVLDKILLDTPHWSDWELVQDSVNHFMIQKGQGLASCRKVEALYGQRNPGVMAVGSAVGSLLFAQEDFWQKYPSGFETRGLAGDEVTNDVWFWSPAAKAMDFRHYAERGYNQICYEGYDYKGAYPQGIACTSNCSVKILDEVIVSDEDLLAYGEARKHQAMYVQDVQYLHDAKAFGYWSLPSRETEMEVWIEQELDRLFAFYKAEVDQRNWYGMFNYGDLMHSYDPVRHTWRYDVGGYGWDNTELVPTLWLWLYFLRSGREDAFTLAEKLSRHSSEVDVYHMGKYRGMGSRHNVFHWGCPCKEIRVSMAYHHRYYYYLTGDRRLGDIFDELTDAELSLLAKDPLGDFYDKEEMVFPTHARSGPEWSSLCANWITDWERNENEDSMCKLKVGLQDIKNAPLQLISGPDFEFDPASCHLRYIGERTTGGTHLQICMGAAQIWLEMQQILHDDEWEKMLADYGRCYFMTDEERQKATDGLVGDREFSLPFMASSMGAFGAYYFKDEELARRTWKTLLETIMVRENTDGFLVQQLPDKGNREQLNEIAWISTNFAAQFGVNMICCLEFIREQLPKTLEETKALVGSADGRFHKA